MSKRAIRRIKKPSGLRELVGKPSGESKNVNRIVVSPNSLGRYTVVIYENGVRKDSLSGVLFSRKKLERLYDLQEKDLRVDY